MGRCNSASSPWRPKLGLTELLKKFPYEVSGGQKQRAAAARALITHPQLILADEPTGALDSRSSDELLKLFTRDQRGGPDHRHGDPFRPGRQPGRPGPLHPGRADLPPALPWEPAPTSSSSSGFPTP